jgi:23S rRNA (cytidine2498-2'-O)-methyltransferase
MELPGGVTELSDVHVWEHTPSWPAGPIESDGPQSPPFATPLAHEVEQAIRAAAPQACAKLLPDAKLIAKAAPLRRHPSPRHALVLDVVLLSPGEWWLGYHQTATIVERWPGGHVAPELPPHAVSRAYVKLEEAIRWSGLPVAAGDECVEIGCAPGGACQALLERGLFVTGIDPADVAPELPEHPRFRHLKKRGSDVRRHEFTGVRWLVADMNIAPLATLAEVEPIVTHPGVSIRGLVLTLKLSDWKWAEQLDDFVARVRGWGYRDVRVRQLTTGGQEVCLVALRRKALRRLGKKSRNDQRPVRAQRQSAKTNVPKSTAPKSSDASSPPSATMPTPAQRVDPPQVSISGPHF